MKKIILILFVFLNYACKDMEENFEKYNNETVYSEKIENLTAEIGYQRILLKWEKTSSAKAKKIIVGYGDPVVKKEVSIKLDSVYIENLTDNGAYDFNVCSVDAFDNYSVPTMVSKRPISKEYIDNLSISKPSFEFRNDTVTVNFTNLNTQQLRFTGKFSYSYTNAENSKVDSNIVLVDNPDVKTVELYKIDNKTMLNFSFEFIPLINGQLTLDPITKIDSININK